MLRHSGLVCCREPPPLTRRNMTSDPVNQLLTVDASRPGIKFGTALDDRGAFGQLFLAEEYLVAAQEITPPRDDLEALRLLRPRFMLLTHSIELSLKAFLLAVGVDRRELTRRPLNHDLAALLDRAGSFVQFVRYPGHEITIRELAPWAAEFFFRYGNSADTASERLKLVRIPPVEDTMAAARWFYRLAQNQILDPANSYALPDD